MMSASTSPSGVAASSAARPFRFPQSPASCSPAFAGASTYSLALPSHHTSRPEGSSSTETNTDERRRTVTLPPDPELRVRGRSPRGTSRPFRVTEGPRVRPTFTEEEALTTMFLVQEGRAERAAGPRCFSYI